MSYTPPPPEGPNQGGYVGYYRNDQGKRYKAPEKLEALIEGYFGLNRAFLMCVPIGLSASAAQFVIPDPVFGPIVSLCLVGLLMLAVGVLTYPPNKKIAEGMGWNDSSALLASILSGMVGFLCCGAIGLAVMQQIAVIEMKKYGLRVNFFFTKKNAQLKAAAYRSSYAAQQSSRPYQP